MVAKIDLGSIVERRVGSNPTGVTKFLLFMKHENFKFFETPLKKVFTKEVKEFLNGTILPKSISISNHGLSNILSIGYEDSKKKVGSNEYHLISRKFKRSDFSSMEKSIKSAASKIGGVICQDVHIVDDSVNVTFLVTK